MPNFLTLPRVKGSVQAQHLAGTLIMLLALECVTKLAVELKENLFSYC